MATAGGELPGSARLAPPARPPATPVVGLRPLGVGEMLDAAIKVYRSRPRPMIVAATLVTAPAILLQTLISLSAGNPNEITRTDDATGFVTLDGGAFATYLGGLVASTLVIVVANNLALAGTMRMSLSAYLGDETDWRSSIRFARRRFWPLTGVLALTTLGLLAGALLCIVPSFWLQGIWAVAVPALLVEELGPVQALGRSRRLVAGRFWPVLGTVLLGGLLASFLQGVLVAPVLVLQFAGTSFVLTTLLNGLVQVVSVALTTPFVAALTAVIYVDLRVRKEGFDLELMARGVGVDPPPPGPGPDAGTPPVPPVAPAGPVPPPGGWQPAAPPGGWGGPSPPAAGG